MEVTGTQLAAVTSYLKFFNHFSISLLNYSQFLLQCQQPEWTLLSFIPSASFGHFPSLLKTFRNVQWCGRSTTGNSWYWQLAGTGQDGAWVLALKLLWPSMFWGFRLLHGELHLETAAWPSGEAAPCCETMLASGRWCGPCDKRRKIGSDF